MLKIPPVPGKFTNGSCTFGLEDLPTLIKRPEFMAHQFKLDFEPAAYFCLWRTIRERALDEEGQKRFLGSNYKKLSIR
jgi:hypothetical protein